MTDDATTTLTIKPSDVVFWTLALACALIIARRVCARCASSSAASAAAAHHA
tara:strand:- start:1060 stop:1215 length:156 start_codon:yes stop_codon:yes gene_type:complete